MIVKGMKRYIPTTCPLLEFQRERFDADAGLYLHCGTRGNRATADIRVPRFEDYRTKDIFHGKPAPPKIVLVTAKFRSVIAGGRFVNKPFPLRPTWVHNQVA
jgi:hypothetical protein